MNEEQQPSGQNTSVEPPKPTAKPANQSAASYSENVKIIRRICAYITITATTVFAFVAILSIWINVGNDMLWKSFASLAVIGFGSLIVAGVAPLADKK